MRKLVTILILNVLVLTGSLIVLCTIHNTTALLTSGIVFAVETVLTLPTIIWKLIGKISPNIYRFTRLHNIADSSKSDNYIDKKMDNDSISSLRFLYNTNDLHKIFQNGVLIEKEGPLTLNNGSKWKHIEGYVYASNYEEALTILKNYQFYEPDIK